MLRRALNYVLLTQRKTTANSGRIEGPSQLICDIDSSTAKSEVDLPGTMSTTANSIERKPGGLKFPRSVLFLCSPTLVGSILFAFSFPLRRQIPLSTSWTYSDIFFIWWVLVAPLSTIGAIALFFSREYRHRQNSFGKIFGVLLLVVTAVINSFLAYVMWAAVYF